MKRWLNQTELAEIVGLSTRQVRTYSDRLGCPKRKAGADWEYEWPAWVKFYGQERERQGKESARPASADEARARLLAAQAELAELDLAQQRGELMTVEQYEKALGGAYGRVAAQLKTAPTKYAPDILNLHTLPDSVTKLETAFRDAMDELYRGEDLPDDDDDADRKD